jgi:hypothetical protein
MVTTELDAIIAAGVGADVNPEFFTELKANLLLALLEDGSNGALPVYADNAAALADSAPVGSLYSQANGSVWVVLAP